MDYSTQNKIIISLAIVILLSVVGIVLKIAFIYSSIMGLMLGVLCFFLLPSKNNEVQEKMIDSEKNVPQYRENIQKSFPRHEPRYIPHKKSNDAISEQRRIALSRERKTAILGQRTKNIAINQRNKEKPYLLEEK